MTNRQRSGGNNFRRNYQRDLRAFPPYERQDARVQLHLRAYRVTGTDYASNRRKSTAREFYPRAIQRDYVADFYLSRRNCRFASKPKLLGSLDFVVARDRFRKKRFSIVSNADEEKRTVRSERFNRIIKKHEPSHSDFQSLTLALAWVFFFKCFSSSLLLRKDRKLKYSFEYLFIEFFCKPVRGVLLMTLCQ